MASELRVNTLKDADGNNSIATSFVAGGSAKAWQNLNGSSFGLRDSFNTASSTDNGTGDYSHTMTSAMSDANYVVLVASRNEGTNTNTANNIHQGTAPTTSLFRFQHIENGSATDAVFLSSSVNGDLA